MPEQSDRDEFVRECFESWAPRFVTNGMDYNDLQRVEARIDGWDEWCPEFRALGDEHYALGEEAEEAGNTESAAGHFQDASMCYHFGSHVWHVDDDLRDETHQQAVEAFARAGEHLDPPVQRIEAPTGEGFSIPGNLRVPDEAPDGLEESPLVVLLPGLDSIKEELSAYDPTFHDRGMATLAVDGPAQGETWYNHGMTYDYHEYISAMVDHVRDVDPAGVDTSRLGVMGVSLGGWYAPHAAANDQRFEACAGISGPFTVGPISGRGSEMHKEQFIWGCKVDSALEADEITERMTLREDIEDLTAPALMVTGAHDTIIPPEQTERIATRAPKGEYVLYEDGNHVCNNIAYKYQPMVADWFRTQLSG